MAGLPKGGYGIIGRLEMRSQLISKEAKAVYALICSYTGDAQFCFPSIETMATDLKSSPASIKRYVAELVRYKFIMKGKKIASGKGAHNRLNTYWPQFLDPENKQQLTHEPLDGVTSEPKEQLIHEPLLVTDNTNNISVLPQPFKKTQVNKSKNVSRETIDIVKPVYAILEASAYKVERSKTLTTKIAKAIKNHGVEVVCKATMGKIDFMRKEGKPLYFHSFIEDDEAVTWQASKYKDPSSGWNSPQMRDESPADLSELQKTLAVL